MKALTLTQPWATLVAIGAKRIETRSWSTKYTGPIAIHAAKGFPRWAKDTCFDEPFLTALAPQIVGLEPTELPTGAVIAIAEIIGCRFAEDVARQLDPEELAFGDYSPGRFAWFIANARPLLQPIPAKGALGLWEWAGKEQNGATGTPA